MNYTKTFLPKRSHEYLRAKIGASWHNIRSFKKAGTNHYVILAGNVEINIIAVELWEIL